MLTKGAIGNLVNRYRAVLQKCNLINTFGSLAVASMLVLGGAGVASAANGGIFEAGDTTQFSGSSLSYTDVELNLEGADADGFWAKPHTSGTTLTLGGEGKSVNITVTNTTLDYTPAGIYAKSSTGNGASIVTVTGSLLNVNVTGNGDTYALMASSAQDTLPAADKRGILNVTSDTVVLTATNTNTTSGVAGGMVSFTGGELNVNAKSLTVNAENAAIVRGNSILRVNANEDGSVYDADAVVTLNGNILFDVDLTPGAESGVENPNADVTINLTNESSSLTGRITTQYADTDGDLTIHGPKNEEVSNMSLHLANGASWNATGHSFVNTLEMEKGNINIAEGVAIDAGTVDGEGNINMVDATSSFTADTASAGTALNVQAITEDGKVKTADEVDTATLKAMMDKVNAGDAQISASAADGIVNAGFTTDSEGTITSGGGASSVTKAVLEAASVNTIALDKLLTNDVRKRMGDLRSDKNESGVWMRWDGGKLKGNGLTNDFNTIQIGGDTKVGKNCRLGVAGSFTHGDAEFDRGNGQLEGFSFAAYSTWMGENGMFADVVARLGHFSTEMNVEGLKGDMDNRVFSLSGEYGWRFDVCQQFFVEPQVELAYTYVNSEELQLGDARFSFDSVDSLTGRLGLVAGWNLPNDMGNVYARASVLQQFMGDAKVTGFSGVEPTIHKTDGDDTWLEYGIGANVKLNDKTYIWADVERTEGASIDEEWRGTVGLRYSF